MISLEEKLRSEVRRCAQCRFEISNPFVGRCPRCLAPVPVIDPGCSSCVHGNSCPVSRVRVVARDK